MGTGVWSLKVGLFLMSASLEGVVTVMRMSWVLILSMLFQIRDRSSKGSRGKGSKAWRGNELSVSCIADEEEFPVLGVLKYSLSGVCALVVEAGAVSSCDVERGQPSVPRIAGIFLSRV